MRVRGRKPPRSVQVIAAECGPWRVAERHAPQLLEFAAPVQEPTEREGPPFLCCRRHSGHPTWPCRVVQPTGRQVQRCCAAEPLSPVPKLESRIEGHGPAGRVTLSPNMLPSAPNRYKPQTRWHSKNPVLACSPLLLRRNGAWRSLVARVLWEH